MTCDSLRERRKESICRKRGGEEAHEGGGGLMHGYGVFKLLHFHLHLNQALIPTTPPPARQASRARGRRHRKELLHESNEGFEELWRAEVHS